MLSYRSSAVSLWNILFRLEGNILVAVLPFCIVNCLLLWWVSTLENFGFSPTGHGLLTLLVSFLVIQKVNIAYDRFTAVRYYAGHGAIVLRELIQMAIVISMSAANNSRQQQQQQHNNTTTTNRDGSYINTDTTNNNDNDNDLEKELRYWRLECVAKCTEIFECSIQVYQDQNLSKHFARNKPYLIDPNSQKLRDNNNNNNNDNDDDDDETLLISQDPMIHIQALRLHVYCASDLGLQLLERLNLASKLNEYTTTYNHLLTLSSTPLPFSLVQMGRAFLLVWTFSMPLVLLEGPFTSFWAAQAFLFFLTYGFIGLELASIKLSDPFGDSRDDVQLKKIRDALIHGIENDLKQIPNQTTTISARRLLFSQQKQQKRRTTTTTRNRQKPQQQQQQHNSAGHEKDDHNNHEDHDVTPYYAMAESNVELNIDHP